MDKLRVLKYSLYMPKPPQNLTELSALKKIVADLRGPEGCPWDKEQTTFSLTPYLIEECFELIEVLEKQNWPAVREELGDLLFQIVLHSQMASECGHFQLEQVIESISSKMLRRHPHVFADVKVQDSQEVIANWDQIKKSEKSTPNENPIDVPIGLPALQRAYKIGKKTQKIKFDWDHHHQVLEKVEEEFAELKVELKKDPQSDATAEELGDLLFSIAQLARHLDLEPEQILRQANLKFETRFQLMWKQALSEKKDFLNMSLEEKETRWKKAKKSTR